MFDALIPRKLDGRVCERVIDWMGRSVSPVKVEIMRNNEN